MWFGRGVSGGQGSADRWVGRGPFLLSVHPTDGVQHHGGTCGNQLQRVWSCSSGQSLDTVWGLDSCRQEGCREGARRIGVKGPCAWPFKGCPCLWEVSCMHRSFPVLWTASVESCPEEPAGPFPWHSQNRCCVVMAACPPDPVLAGTVRDSLFSRMIPSLRSKTGAPYSRCYSGPFLLDPTWIETKLWVLIFLW